MSRFTLPVSVLGALLLVATGGQSATATMGENAHAYFDALVARADHWKSFSLRDKTQLDYRKNGGYAAGNSGELWVTYSPETDTDPNRQDAAKVVIPAWKERDPLVIGMSAKDEIITVVDTKIVGNQSAIMIAGSDEIMRVNRIEGELLGQGQVRVLRGQYGTTPTAHAAGAIVSLSSNSLQHQVRLPLGTEDGHTYFFVWDGYWTDSYVNTGLGNHKTFQFSSGGAIWLEPNTMFRSRYNLPTFDPNVHVSGIGIRGYNKTGGDFDHSLTDGNRLRADVERQAPLSPRLGGFNVHPNRWTRFFVRIQQRANDYDVMDYWVADEHTAPVQINSGIHLSVREGAIDQFYLEFNTSTDEFVRGDPKRDFVSYVRNFVALRDPGDVTGFLQQPGGFAPLPPVLTPLEAPRNLRIAP